jgi:type III pantothenate kinase
MLLTLDVGNTNTVLGVFREKELVAHWRLTTARDQTVDEYGILTRDLFTLANLEPRAIGGVIISSVVPTLNSTLAGMADRYFGMKALFVEPGIKTGMPVHYDNPQEVGADRIVNSVAAFDKYGGPCIIVDFGTAMRSSPAPHASFASKSKIPEKSSARTPPLRCRRASSTVTPTWSTEFSRV